MRYICYMIELLKTSQTRMSVPPKPDLMGLVGISLVQKYCSKVQPIPALTLFNTFYMQQRAYLLVEQF
jgi:hypothetical protein